MANAQATPYDHYKLLDRLAQGPMGLPQRSPIFSREQAMPGLAQGRINLYQSQIAYQRFNGRYIEVGGELVEIPPQRDFDTPVDPATRFMFSTTDGLLNAAGGVTGTGVAASTLYYVYVGNSRVPGAATRMLRLSATAPTLRADDGVRYLGAYGQAANWRFVGWVRTTAAPAFADDTTDRLVVNYYNRQRKNLIARPGYSDNNAETTFTTTSGTWTPANAGTNARVTYISNGEDAVRFIAVSTATSSSGATAAGIGIGIDSTTTASKGAWVSNSTAFDSTAVSHSEVSAEGYHTADILVVSYDGVNTVTYYADGGRDGSAADVPMTYIEGEVWV